MSIPNPESCVLSTTASTGYRFEPSTELARAVKQIHMELDLGTCSRTDLILTDDDFYFLETNTCPGMTERSLVPYSARESGLEGVEFVRRMVEGAYRPAPETMEWRGGWSLKSPRRVCLWLSIDPVIELWKKRATNSSVFVISFCEDGLTIEKGFVIWSRKQIALRSHD